MKFDSKRVASDCSCLSASCFRYVITWESSVTDGKEPSKQRLMLILRYWLYGIVIVKSRLIHDIFCREGGLFM
jgi:hypothetical protein